MAVNSLSSYEDLMTIAQKSMEKAIYVVKHNREAASKLFDTAEKFIAFAKEAPGAVAKLEDWSEIAPLFHSSEEVVELATYSREAAAAVLHFGKAETRNSFDTFEKLLSLANESPDAAEVLAQSDTARIAGLLDSAPKITKLAKKAPQAALHVLAAEGAKLVPFFDSADKIIKLARSSSDTAAGIAHLDQEGVARLFDKYSLLQLGRFSVDAACEINKVLGVE